MNEQGAQGLWGGTDPYTRPPQGIADQILQFHFILFEDVLDAGGVVIRRIRQEFLSGHRFFCVGDLVVYGWLISAPGETLDLLDYDEILNH